VLLVKLFVSKTLIT